jgi:hypothetical protein
MRFFAMRVFSKNGRRLIYGEAECRAGRRTLTHHTLTYVSAD